MLAWSAFSVPRLPGSGGPLHVLDTASGLPVAVHPEDGTVGLYVCGITPYDATHLGHAATYVTFDLMLRVLRDAGLSVTYVQNVTDIDDPLLERAARDGVDWQDLAAEEIQLFFTDMQALRVLPPQHYIGAVEGIPDDVSAVEQLLDSGSAYTLDEDVYLEVAQSPHFGAVSGWSREQMLEVYADRGGDPERPGKRDALDPMLWRAERSGEPSWDGGRLGAGRPGWHIECSTIALRYLGMGFTIQGGGNDLIFPHHEMSAVQAVSLTGRRPFAQVYVHQAMVGLDGEKMSKSQGNLVLVSALRERGVDPMAIRLVLLDQHYRTAWSYREELLEQATARLARWRTVAERVDAAVGPDAHDDETISAIRLALADDLNSPEAVRLVDDWMQPWQDSPPRGTAPSPLVPRAVEALLGIPLLPASDAHPPAVTGEA
ncbi:MAG: cysteine--1-D-myo-inosityl 2-amino-2-deoxy-alpha-D-glucopyranoside ligase [Ornithinimicrobium sp.]